MHNANKNQSVCPNVATYAERNLMETDTAEFQLSIRWMVASRNLST
jgi:hypothetical protein